MRKLSAKTAARETLSKPPAKLVTIIQVRMEKSGMVMRHLEEMNSRHYNLDNYHLEKGSNLKKHHFTQSVIAKVVKQCGKLIIFQPDHARHAPGNVIAPE